jgi:hypothetical protein
MRDIYPTKHAIETMEARNVSWGEIVSVVENPDVVYGPDQRGRKVVQRDDLTVVLGGDGAIVTVLLREVNEWTDEDARGREEGRRTNGTRRSSR